MPQSQVAIQEEFKLPSNGRLYGGTIPTNVSLRCMNTMDERLRLSSTSPYKVTPQIVRNCLVGSDFDTTQLKLFDLYYLIFKLRIITYGPDYKVKVHCRSCNSDPTIIVDLDDLEVNSEPFAITLPVSGDTLTCRYLSCADLNDLQSSIDRMKMKAPDADEDELSFIPSLCARIETVNGEAWPQGQTAIYLQNMHAKDYNYFEQKYVDITNKPGINMNYVATCPKCGSPITFQVPILREFFRPSID